MLHKLSWEKNSEAKRKKNLKKKIIFTTFMIFRFTDDMRRQTVQRLHHHTFRGKKILNVDLQPWEKNMSLQCRMPLSADTSMSIYSLQHPCHTSVHRRIWIYTTRRIHRFPFTFLSLSLPPSLSLPTFPVLLPLSSTSLC